MSELTNQIKSRQRVSDHGEVFTSVEVVDKMLDLVKEETQKLDSRFLEPACGEGIFLIKVLERKLAVLVAGYAQDQEGFEKQAVVMMSSLYGIDILEDNVLAARKALLQIFEATYTKIFNYVSPEILEVVAYVLGKNIIHGDALSMRCVAVDAPIIFCEWALIGDNIQRRDFTFKELTSKQIGFFATLPPRPCKEYPLLPYSKITNFDLY